MVIKARVYQLSPTYITQWASTLVQWRLSRYIIINPNGGFPTHMDGSYNPCMIVIDIQPNTFAR